MFARIQITAARPAALSPDRPPIQTILAGHPGYRGLVLCTQPDGRGGSMISFWATEGDAREASARTRAAAGVAPKVELSYDEIFAVSSVQGGGAGSPAVAQLVFFDGPRDVHQQAQDNLAAGILAPAVSAMPGITGQFGLLRPDGGFAVVLFADSHKSLDDAERAVFATPMAAGGSSTSPRPDRVVRYTIELAALPAAVEV